MPPHVEKKNEIKRRHKISDAEKPERKHYWLFSCILCLLMHPYVK
jgi:hypothetical protein